MRVQGDNMPNQTENCEFKGCEKKFTFTNVSDYVELMKAHNAAKHNGGGANSSTKPEKAKRPELSGEVSDEDWAYFCARFEQYKDACKLTKTEDIVTQLLECASDQIRRDHHRTYSGAGTRDEKTILEQLKTIAVKKQNIAVNRMKLGSMKQGHGEPVRKFAGRVRSLATVCEYTVKCTREDCNLITYAEEAIVDQVIRGLANTEIQKDVLGSEKTNLEKLLIFVEGKESGHECGGKGHTKRAGPSRKQKKASKVLAGETGDGEHSACDASIFISGNKNDNLYSGVLLKAGTGLIPVLLRITRPAIL